MSDVSQWFSGFRFKMLILIGVPCLLIVALVGTSIIITKQVAKSASQVTDVRVPSLQGLQLMEEARSLIQIEFAKSIYNHQQNHVDTLGGRIVSGLEKYKKGWDIYAPLEQTPEEAAQWSQFSPLSGQWEEKVRKVLSLLRENQLPEAKRIFETELTPVLESSQTSFSRIVSINYEVVEIEKKQFDKTNNNSLLLSFVFGLIGILSTFFIGILLARNLSKDLTYIADSIDHSSSQVSQASYGLSRSAESLSTAVQQQASTIEETSTSLSALVSNVKNNAEIAKNSSENARIVQQISQEATQFMSHLSEAMSSILDSNKRIEMLVKIIEEIAGKTEIIDDIVFKTQLLSFNASVEAERAGEQGRGFAVVAQEVGNLAQMSGQAASEISKIVKNSIREAESVSKENRDRVEKGSELAKDTKNKIERVSSMISEILESVNSISATSSEQSHGLSEINLAVENLSKATQDTAKNSEDAASASTELSGQSNSMQELVSKLRFLLTGNNSLENHEGNSNLSRQYESQNHSSFKNVA